MRSEPNWIAAFRSKFLNNDRVVVAELLRPRGNKGEVLAASQTDVPGRLESLKQGWVTLRGGDSRQIAIEEAWQHKEHWVLKFAGVDSISAAEEFSGLDLWVPRTERARLPEGEFFRTDLMGFSVLNADTSQAVGTVVGWQQYGGPPLMEVKAENREVLIPFVDQICTAVDLEKRTILVNPPEGLLEL